MCFLFSYGNQGTCILVLKLSKANEKNSLPVPTASVSVPVPTWAGMTDFVSKTRPTKSIPPTMGVFSPGYLRHRANITVIM
jgi:hypothetical protein